MFAMLVNEYKLEFQFRKASKDTEFAWAIIVATNIIFSHAIICLFSNSQLGYCNKRMTIVDLDKVSWRLTKKMT